MILYIFVQDLLCFIVSIVLKEKVISIVSLKIPANIYWVNLILLQKDGEMNLAQPNCCPVRLLMLERLFFSSPEL